MPSRVVARRRDRGDRSPSSLGARTNLAAVLPWTQAYWTDGAAFRSLGLANGDAVEYWPPEVDAVGARLDGTKVVLPGGTGIVGDSISTPDSAGISLTSDFTVLGYFTATDWTPAAATNFVTKYVAGGNQRSFRFILDTTSTMSLWTSSDGAVNVTATSSATLASVGFTDGAGGWVAATFRASDARVQFFYSTAAPGADPATISWTQLGTNQLGALLGMFDSTAPLVVGAAGTGGSNAPFVGSCHRAQLRSGSTIATSTAVADMDPNGRFAMQAKFTGALGNVWSVWSSSSMALQTAGQQPTLTASDASFNRRDVVTFDGSNDSLRRIVSYASEPPLSIVAVMRMRSLSAATIRWLCVNSANGNFGVGHNTTPVYAQQLASAVTGGTPTTALRLMRWDLQPSGTNSTVYADGVAVAAGNLGAVTFDRISLGGFGGAESAAVDVAFLGVYVDGDVTALPGWAQFKAAVRTQYRCAVV